MILSDDERVYSSSMEIFHNIINAFYKSYARTTHRRPKFSYSSRFMHNCICNSKLRFGKLSANQL